MRYSVCIIDDKIPAAGTQAQALGIRDTDPLNASNLQLLLNKETWNDAVIKNLTETLLTQLDEDGITPKWELCGFTNPSIYLNNIDKGCFRPDLIVFDWEFPGAQPGSETDSESVLKEILHRTFCLVFIFSEADKKTQIETILSTPEFLQYKERIHYLDKTVNGVDQSNALLQRADAMYASNFSFKFAHTLRQKAAQSMDSMLSELGRASLNDVKNHVAIGGTGKKDFVDFLAERFRATIAGKDIYDLVDQIPAPPETATPDEMIASKVWSNRLYFHRETGDDLVRQGDIVKRRTSYYLVLSADCDLGGFWKKNLGIINTVVLHPLESTNTELKGWLTICTRPQDISDGKFLSLLHQIGKLSEGPFILPFVPFGQTQKHFIAVPKDILSQRIDMPAEFAQLPVKEKARIAVAYPHWSDAERICTVAEPFLTPVIQHVLAAMGGLGVPDYPDHMTQILKKVLDGFSATGATTRTSPAETTASLETPPPQPRS